MLDQLLTTLDVRIEAFARCQACPGWRLSFDADPTPSIHVVTFGSGHVCVPGHEPIAVEQDTVVVLPKDVAHTFENSAWRGSEHHHCPSEHGFGPALPTIRAGNPVAGENCLIVACGTIRTAFAGALGLFDAIERPLVTSLRDHSLGARFEALLHELEAPALGTRPLAEAFLKQAIVLLVRRLLREGDGWPAWLQAFRDPMLATAMSAMMNEPGRPFTLEELAASVGLSRSAFADRFTAVVGQPPIEFLKLVRLHRAARLLEVTNMPVKTVAMAVGYTSRSYFSRAFRSVFGLDPSDHRSRQRGAGIPPQG